MSVYRRAGSPFWCYDFAVRGHRFRGSTGTAERSAAEAVETRLRAAALERATAPRELTLDQALGRYYEDHAKRLPSEPDIVRGGALLLRHFGKTLRLTELSNDAVARYVAKRRGQVSDASVNRETAVLRAVYRTARDRWGAEVAPIDWRLHVLREPAPRDRFLSREEAARLLDHAPAHLKGPILFSLFTGARLANVVRLDWAQIDLTAREVRFRAKSKLPGGKPHVVPLAEPVFILLASLGPKAEGAVWLYKGQPLRDWMWSFRDTCRRAGIQGLRWHDLRRTAATWALQGGARLDEVQLLLGHADIRTTQRYAHRDPDAKRRAVAAITDAFSPHAVTKALKG